MGTAEKKKQIPNDLVATSDLFFTSLAECAQSTPDVRSDVVTLYAVTPDQSKRQKVRTCLLYAATELVNIQRNVKGRRGTDAALIGRQEFLDMLNNYNRKSGLPERYDHFELQPGRWVPPE